MSDSQSIMKIPKGMADDIRQLLDRGMSSLDVVEVLVKQTGIGREGATAIVRAVVLAQVSDMTPDHRSKEDDSSFSAILNKSPLDLIFDEPAYRPGSQYTSFLFNRGCAAMLVGLLMSIAGIALMYFVFRDSGLSNDTSADITPVFIVGGLTVAGGLTLFIRGALGRI